MDADENLFVRLQFFAGGDQILRILNWLLVHFLNQVTFAQPNFSSRASSSISAITTPWTPGGHALCHCGNSRICFAGSRIKTSTYHYGVGRGKGVGRGRGVTLGVGVGVPGVGVGVVVGVTVGVPEGVGVADGVGVGVGPPTEQKISVDISGVRPSMS